MPFDPNAALPAGIGNAQQAQQATWFLRNQPWYQQWLTQNRIPLQGDQYGNVTLSDAQQNDLLNQARQHGIGISDSYQIDQNGQIAQTPSHLWRNIGIGAAIGGAALTGFGAAGIGPLAGLLGGSSAAAGAAGAGIGGAEAGASAGLGAAALPGAMASLPAIGAAGGAAGAATTGAGMASLLTNPQIISSGIGGGLQYAGGKSQANANEQAAELQHQSTEEALADARAQRQWQQDQYQNYLNNFNSYQQRLQPFQQFGTQQAQTLGQLLARSPYAAAAQGQTVTPQRYDLPASSIGSLIAKS